MNTPQSTEEQVFRLPAAQELLDARNEIERLRALLLPFGSLLLPNGDLYVNACRDVRNYFAGSVSETEGKATRAWKCIGCGNVYAIEREMCPVCKRGSADGILIGAVKSTGDAS